MLGQTMAELATRESGLYTCVKTIKAVTAMCVCWFNKRLPSYTHCPVWQLSGKQTSGENTAAGLSITDRWPCFSTHVDCTLSRSLLLSRDERNWATALSGSCRADYRPSQLWLRNRISPRQPPVEGAHPCVTDADNAVYWMHAPGDYDRSNSKCQKTKFEFEFINQTSNFRTSFNNLTLDIHTGLCHE